MNFIYLYIKTTKNFPLQTIAIFSKIKPKKGRKILKVAKNRQILAILKATLFALVLSFSSLNAFSGGEIEKSATVGYQCKMQIANPGCTGDICMNNYKNIGYLQQENQWCYANNYYFTYDNDYINPYTSIKNGVSNSEYWLNSQTGFVPINDFHGEFDADINAEALWENNHSFLSAGNTQIENKNDMSEYYSLLDNIYSNNGDYDNTFVLPDLPYCDGYVFNGYDGGYDGAGLFTYCNAQTLTANYTSLDGTITIGSNSYDLEHLSNIAPLALNLEEDPDATYRFVCDSSSYELDYCNNQYVMDYLGNIQHSENEHGYAYISPLAVFMMAYIVPSSGSYFSADCSDQTLMECFGIGLDGNLPNGGNLYDYSRESVEEFMKNVFEYDDWGFGVDGNSPQFAPDSRQYQLMKLVNQYGIMRRNMVFESLGSGSGGSSGGTTPTPTTITLNWNENGGNAIANGSCTYGGNLTLPSAPTRSGYTFTGWKLANGTIKSAGETVSGGCTSTYTGVSSGTSTSITAQWTPATITINWDENGGGAVENGSCTYGGDLILPFTPDNYEYIFNGWKLANGKTRNAGETISGGCNETYIGGIISNVATGVQAQWLQQLSCTDLDLTNKIGFDTHAEDFNYDSSKGEFIVNYGNKGTLHGRSQCSARGVDTLWLHDYENYTIEPEDDITDTLPDDAGTNCYCQLDGYAPVGGNMQPFKTSWVHYYNEADYDQCVAFCASNCAYLLDADGNAPDGNAFRSALFNSVLNTCSPDVYTISFITNGIINISQLQPYFGKSS